MSLVLQPQNYLLFLQYTLRGAGTLSFSFQEIYLCSELRTAMLCCTPCGGYWSLWSLCSTSRQTGVSHLFFHSFNLIQICWLWEAGITPILTELPGSEGEKEFAK